MNLENYITYMECPKCGASMKLKQGWKWKCEYCDTSFYVLPENNVEFVSSKLAVDKFEMDRMKKINNFENFERVIKENLSEKIAYHLLKNNYFIFDKRTNGYLCDFTDYIATLIVVKKGESKNNNEKD